MSSCKSVPMALDTGIGLCERISKKRIFAFVVPMGKEKIRFLYYCDLSGVFARVMQF